MNELIQFIISYVGVLLIGFFLFNFLSNGFLATFIRVRASRGRKTLVEIFGVTNTYYRAGEFDGAVLKFKNMSKNQKRIHVPEGCVYRRLGLASVSVDDELNAVLKRDFDAVEGFDAEVFDNLLTRAETMPEIEVDKKEIIIIVMLVVVIIGLLVVGFMTKDLKDVVVTLQASGVIN